MSFNHFLSKQGEIMVIYKLHHTFNRAIVVMIVIMVVVFTTTCVISAYYHRGCEFELCSWQGVLDTTLCDKVYQWLATGQWFSPGIPVSSTNETDRHDITEILLKVA